MPVDNLLIASLCIYLLSFIFLRKKHVSMVLFLLGSLVNLSALLWNWYFIGHPPFGNMYQVMVVLGACFLPLYLIMVVHQKRYWLACYFPPAAALPIIVAVIVGRDDLWHQPPALQSVWFIPHVVSYMISYSIATIAFPLGLVALVKKRAGNSRGENRYEQVSYQLLAFAFPLMTFGILSGAIWADSAWASYWSWDPKETWSLITWTLYLIYFHCRKTPGMRGYAGMAQVLAFLALLTTFLLVNLLAKLSSPLHSFG